MFRDSGLSRIKLMGINNELIGPNFKKWLFQDVLTNFLHIRV